MTEVEIQPPVSSDSTRSLKLRVLPGGTRVSVQISDVSMLGKRERVAVTVNLIELLDAVRNLTGAS